MAYEINTLSELLDRVNDDRCIDRSDVAPRVQDAMVWHAIASYPGCLGDNHAVTRSREAALESVEYWLDDEKEYSPRYVKGQLRRTGICYLRDGRVITLERHDAGQLF